MYRYIPNGITLGRIIIAPPTLVLAFFMPSSPKIHLLVLILAIAIAVSDTIDGRLARRWHCISDFGKKWDPIADKLAVQLFWPLAWLGMIHIIPVIILMARDLLSTVLRRITKGVASARLSGKIKTVNNLIFMCVLLAAVPIEKSYVPLLAEWRYALYWASGLAISGICIWSGIDYCRHLRADAPE